MFLSLFKGGAKAGLLLVTEVFVEEQNIQSYKQTKGCYLCRTAYVGGLDIQGRSSFYVTVQLLEEYVMNL